MPHRHVEVSQTGFQGIPLHDHDHLKIHRLWEDPSPSWDISLAQIVVYATEGEFHLEDRSKPGQISKILAGDVTHIDQDSFIAWNSPNNGKGFAAMYAPTDRHEDIAVKKYLMRTE